MASENKYDQLVKLIDMGRQKGYLLYDEINEMLPANVNDMAEIEEIIGTFMRAGIEVIEESPQLHAEEKMEDMLDEAKLDKLVAILTPEGTEEIAKKLRWKKIGIDGLGGGNSGAERTKVPGGWLLYVYWGEGSGLTFCPDPEHKWDGNSLP